MSIFVTHVLSLLIYPVSLGTLTLIIGLCVVRCWWRLGRCLLILGTLVIWVPATPAFSAWIRGSLEQLHPPQTIVQVPVAEAIVVLGGGISPVIPPRLRPDLTAAADRVLHAARLYRAGKAQLIIVSGGALAWHKPQTPEADAMQQLLQEWDVPAHTVLVEKDSRNTFENAVFTGQILKERGVGSVLLVTSALHMRRALAVFQSMGIYTMPAPTDYEIADDVDLTLLSVLPDAAALEGSTRAIKEWVGYWVYKRRGWIQ